MLKRRFQAATPFNYVRLFEINQTMIDSFIYVYLNPFIMCPREFSSVDMDNV